MSADFHYWLSGTKEIIMGNKAKAAFFFMRQLKGE
jgi:hypothetical protein